MKKVTAISEGRRGKRVNVFLDGKFAFSLEAEVAVREGLGVGQELSEGDIEALAGADLFQRCLNAALHYLGYRPRSEAELRQRLHRRGFDGDNVETAIARLKEQGLVDDLAFAQFWKDNRQSFSPRSQWLTRSELRQKGVAKDIIDQVVADVDDEDSAYRAAMSRARSLPTADYQSFRRRLGEYLKRRGFGYGVISHTVQQVWQEIGSRSR
ncbi:MAG: RecX family transcriptional regulator [Dehalococcoidales bacterium]|nr:RecX family transcriptional regulator [Dehalococcoidales bacterium]